MIYYIYIPTGLNTPMLEILLSEAQELIHKKKIVEFIVFKPGEVFTCSKNIFSQKFISIASEEKIKKGLKKINGNYKISYISNKKKYPEIIRKVNLKNTKNIKKFNFEGIDFGNAINSSYIGLSRDAEFDGLLKHYSLRNLLNSSLNIYFFFKEKLKVKSKVILYNGRHNESRPIVRYCNKNNISIDVMEFSGDGEKNIGVRRFKNHLPTDLKNMEKLIKDFWKYKSPRDNKCDYYFKYKRAGRVINDRVSYILKQTKKLLPVGWDKNKKNIVYFTSSQDEYSCLGGVYDQTIYKNQNESIFKIVNDFKRIRNKKYNLFIRCHPYLKDVFWNYNKDVINLHDPKNNIFVVKPDSPVSSYEMLLGADKVLTYNSQTGIEAVYWQKPSIILGRRVYENLNCVYKPKNHKKLLQLLFNDNLKPKPKLGSIIYASYWVDGGFTYKSFSGSMKTGYKFKNKSIVNSFFIKILYLIAKGTQYYFYNYFLNYKFGKILKLLK
tara:strand:- start:1665 stop:3149 length:1485 start_codon:yes stop_codon:yes gene_type:complete